jgi:excisionase family DNA binding protein
MPAVPASSPTTDIAREASEAERHLRRLTQRHPGRALRLTGDGAPADVVVVPAPAVELLVRVLSHLANGETVTILPDRAELTTQQAAALLRVSRPTLIQLLEAGRIPHRRVGTHRRVRLDDLLAFQAREAADRASALAELTAEAQALGLGY